MTLLLSVIKKRIFPLFLRHLFTHTISHSYVWYSESSTGKYVLKIKTWYATSIFSFRNFFYSSVEKIKKLRATVVHLKAIKGSLYCQNFCPNMPFPKACIIFIITLEKQHEGSSYYLCCWDYFMDWAYMAQACMIGGTWHA